MTLRKFIHTVLGSVLLSACTSTASTGTSEEPVLPGLGSAPIAFASPLSRAIANQNTLSSFSVWGWYTPTSPASGSSPRPEVVFSGTEVQSDGSYTDTRYWTDGMTYQFYAIHPHNTAQPNGFSATAQPDGMTVENFRTEDKGAQTPDLMTAISHPMAYSTAQGASPVKLTFHHELARVKFSATAQGKNDIALKNISLVNFHNLGHFHAVLQNNQWTRSWTFPPLASGKLTQAELMIPGQTTEGTHEYQDLFEGYLLLIPQTLDDNIIITATMEYPNHIVESITMSSQLNAVGTREWKSGMSYHYRVMLPANMENPKINVTVEPWDTKDIYEDLN